MLAATAPLLVASGAAELFEPPFSADSNAADFPDPLAPAVLVATAAAALTTMVVAVGESCGAAEAVAGAGAALGLSIDSSCDAFACGDAGAAGDSLFTAILSAIVDE